MSERPVVEDPEDGHTGQYVVGDVPVVDALDVVVENDEKVRGVFLVFTAVPLGLRAAVGHGQEDGFFLPGVQAWALRAEPWWPTSRRVWIARQMAEHASCWGRSTGHGWSPARS